MGAAVIAEYTECRYPSFLFERWDSTNPNGGPRFYRHPMVSAEQAA